MSDNTILDGTLTISCWTTMELVKQDSVLTEAINQISVSRCTLLQSFANRSVYQAFHMSSSPRYRKYTDDSSLHPLL